MTTESIPNFLFIDERTEQILDPRLSRYFTYTDGNKLEHHRFHSNIKIPEELQLISQAQQSDTSIFNLAYSSKHGCLFMNNNKEIRIYSLPALQQSILSGKLNNQTNKYTVIKNGGNLFLSPEQSKLLVLNPHEITVYQLSSPIKQLTKIKNNIQATNVCWSEGSKIVYCWSFEGNAYQLKLNQQQKQCKVQIVKLEEIKHCTGISRIGDNNMVFQGMNMHIFEENVKSKSLGLDQLKNGDSYSYQYSTIIGISKTNNHDKDDFDQTDTYAFITVYYTAFEQGDTQLCKRTVFFLKGNLLQQDSLKVRGNQVILTLKDQQQLYYSGEQGNKKKIGFSCIMQSYHNMIICSVQKLPYVFLIDGSQKFQKLNMFSLWPKHTYQLNQQSTKSKDTFMKGFAVMQNMFNFQRQFNIDKVTNEDDKQKHQSIGIFCRQYKGQFLRLYFEHKEAECTIQFPLSVWTFSDHSLYRKLAASTIDCCEDNNIDEIKKYLDKNKQSRYIQHEQIQPIYGETNDKMQQKNQEDEVIKQQKKQAKKQTKQQIKQGIEQEQKSKDKVNPLSQNTQQQKEPKMQLKQQPKTIIKVQSPDEHKNKQQNKQQPKPQIKKQTQLKGNTQQKQQQKPQQKQQQKPPAQKPQQKPPAQKPSEINNNRLQQNTQKQNKKSVQNKDAPQEQAPQKKNNLFNPNPFKDEKLEGNKKMNWNDDKDNKSKKEDPKTNTFVNNFGSTNGLSNMFQGTINPAGSNPWISNPNQPNKKQKQKQQNKTENIPVNKIGSSEPGRSLFGTIKSDQKQKQQSKISSTQQNKPINNFTSGSGMFSFGTNIPSNNKKDQNVITSSLFDKQVKKDLKKSSSSKDKGSFYPVYPTTKPTGTIPMGFGSYNSTGTTTPQPPSMVSNNNFMAMTQANPSPDFKVNPMQSFLNNNKQSGFPQKFQTKTDLSKNLPNNNEFRNTNPSSTSKQQSTQKKQIKLTLQQCQQYLKIVAKSSQIITQTLTNYQSGDNGAYKQFNITNLQNLNKIHSQIVNFDDLSFKQKLTNTLVQLQSNNRKLLNRLNKNPKNLNQAIKQQFFHKYHNSQLKVEVASKIYTLFQTNNNNKLNALSLSKKKQLTNKQKIILQSKQFTRNMNSIQAKLQSLTINYQTRYQENRYQIQQIIYNNNNNNNNNNRRKNNSNMMMRQNQRQLQQSFQINKSQVSSTKSNNLYKFTFDSEQSEEQQQSKIKQQYQSTLYKANQLLEYYNYYQDDDIGNNNNNNRKQQSMTTNFNNNNNISGNKISLLLNKYNQVNIQDYNDMQPIIKLNPLLERQKQQKQQQQTNINNVNKNTQKQISTTATKNINNNNNKQPTIFRTRNMQQTNILSSMVVNKKPTNQTKIKQTVIPSLINKDTQDKSQVQSECFENQQNQLVGKGTKLGRKGSNVQPLSFNNSSSSFTGFTGGGMFDKKDKKQGDTLFGKTSQTGLFTNSKSAEPIKQTKSTLINKDTSKQTSKQKNKQTSKQKGKQTKTTEMFGNMSFGNGFGSLLSKKQQTKTEGKSNEQGIQNIQKKQPLKPEQKDTKQTTLSQNRPKVTEPKVTEQTPKTKQVPVEGAIDQKKNPVEADNAPKKTTNTIIAQPKNKEQQKNADIPMNNIRTKTNKQLSDDAIKAKQQSERAKKMTESNSPNFLNSSNPSTNEPKTPTNPQNAFNMFNNMENKQGNQKNLFNNGNNINNTNNNSNSAVIQAANSFANSINTSNPFSKGTAANNSSWTQNQNPSTNQQQYGANFGQSSKFGVNSNQANQSQQGFDPNQANFNMPKKDMKSFNSVGQSSNNSANFLNAGQNNQQNSMQGGSSQQNINQQQNQGWGQQQQQGNQSWGQQQNTHDIQAWKSPQQQTQQSQQNNLGWGSQANPIWNQQPQQQQQQPQGNPSWGQQQQQPQNSFNNSNQNMPTTTPNLMQMRQPKDD